VFESNEMKNECVLGLETSAHEANMYGILYRKPPQTLFYREN
jgi:hypothetical protein